jgi:hypothetical protein
MTTRTYACKRQPSQRQLVLVRGVLLVGAVLWICGFCVAGAPAAPVLGVSSLSAGGFNGDGSPSTQAGAHPWELVSSFRVSTFADSQSGIDMPTAAVKDTVFDLPPGVIGNPSGVAQCREATLPAPLTNCPTSTQVGYADVDVMFIFHQVSRVPVYNMVPPAGEPAQFRFKVVGAFAHIDVHIRSDGDYGATATVHNINAAAPVFGASVHLWGVPADASHDAQRFLVNSPSDLPGDLNGNPLPSSANRVPFLRNPTSCSGPVTTTLRATSWEEPSQVVTAVAGAPAVTGCARVPFAPTIKVAPDTKKAGAVAGLGVDVDVPQNENPDGLASADLKRVVMKLPAGVTINPSAADGLDGCTDSEFGLRVIGEDRCPDASKLGTVTITTPLLDDPVKGDVFLASPLEQGPVAAAAGRMFRLFMEGESHGVRVKLAGSVVPDPVTGQLTATFDNNPQLPFSNLHLQLDGGSRAPLATPKACGTYTTEAVLTPWTAPDAPSVETSSSFVIDQDCDKAGKFEPTVTAGVTDRRAAGSSSFVLDVARPDGQQDMTGVEVSLPPGVLAHVGSVPLCGDGDAAAGTCPAASQIGHTTAASGVGSTPVYIPQPGKAPTAVFLAGPYKGAPYSLSIVVPAQAGPFDLGTVVVRATLNVDPVDAHASVVSDPIPTMLLGVPLSIQRINVVIDRPGFMVNPTNCAAMKIASKVLSATTAVTGTTPFQVSGCSALALKPKLSLDLSGKGQTTDGKHPALDAHLTMPTGNANLKDVKVTLPLSLALDTNNSQSDDLCEFEVGRQTIPECPARSIVGSVTAKTPLLNVPLTGPVYFVKNVRTDPKSGRQIRTLPTLAIPLRGGGITLVIRATSEVVDNHLVTTFANIPDAPVSDFKMKINGGAKDILVVSGADICKSTQITEQVATGQNGKVADADITMGSPCALGVVGSSHTASALKLTVSGLGAGKVSASGTGLVKTTRSITTATTATLQPKFTKTVAARLRRGQDVKVRVTIAFTPKGAKKAKTTHKTITIHG